MENIGYVHSIESFGSVDGPGVRFIIFLSGCPLRCRYCHNPDTWSRQGTARTVSDVLNQAVRYRPYWGEQGGITVSGGEPLLQIDFLLELFTEAKKLGISTCIDTSGSPFTKEGEWFEKFQKLMKVTDLLLMDIKHINEEEHVKLTGKTGKNIREMFAWLNENNKPIWIRHVLVPGITDVDEYLVETRDFIRSLNNVYRVEVLPYHSLGSFKWKELGLEYTLDKTEMPDQDRVANARKLLECDKYLRWQGENASADREKDTAPRADACGRSCC